MKSTEAAVGRDGNDAKEKKGDGGRAMKLMYQMDAQEMDERLREDPNYVPTLEDEIEFERQKKIKELKASGKPGTPVTEASLKAWQDRKRKRKADENKKLVEAEMKKKGKNKGLSMLSGRALYEYNQSLFVDDANVQDIDTKNLKGIEEENEEMENDEQDADNLAKLDLGVFTNEGDIDLEDLEDSDSDEKAEA